MSSLSHANFRQSLEEILDEFEDCECDSGYCKHRSDSAFDKSNDEEISESSSKEYPVQAKKKKSRKGRRKVIKIEKLWQMQIVGGDVSAFSLALKRATGLKTTTESLHFLVRCHA